MLRSREWFKSTGELFALRWANVDLDGVPPTDRVEERVYAGQVVERTKTKALPRET
jgi:hypothetical protein